MNTQVLRGAEMFRAALDRAARLVIKIGSNQLVDPANGLPRANIFEALATDIAGLRQRRAKCVLVTSGAVAFGRHRLGLPMRRALSLDEKQAAAAVGQLLLAEAWARAFSRHAILTGQALLCPEDTEHPVRLRNASNTFERLFKLGVLPLVNENDTVATEELRYGDNDCLAARLTSLVRAEGLILLSDIDGLYTADPSIAPDASPIEHVPLSAIAGLECGGPPRTGGPGTGGMASKLEAARIAVASGCWVVIARASDRPLGPPRQDMRLTFFARDTAVANAGRD